MAMNFAKMVKKIGTHNGPFHADESLAIYMLKLLPEFKDAEVIRTRHQEILEECDIIVDVGAKYEPPRYYDHHQKGFDTYFDEKHTVTKLSSAGLIYKHFGHRILASCLDEKEDSELVKGIYVKIYESFIEDVDANDNGVNAYAGTPKYDTYGGTLRAVVSNFMPPWTQQASPSEVDQRFFDAVKFMGVAFEAEVKQKARGWYPAREKVEQAFSICRDYDSQGRLLVFGKSYAPWGSYVHDMEKVFGCTVLYALYKSEDSYRIQAVPVEKGSFESRKPLKESWRGLRGEDLTKETGIPGCVFVHASGFIGGNETEEGALAMARAMLEDS